MSIHSISSEYANHLEHAPEACMGNALISLGEKLYTAIGEKLYTSTTEKFCSIAKKVYKIVEKHYHDKAHPPIQPKISAYSKRVEKLAIGIGELQSLSLRQQNSTGFKARCLGKLISRKFAKLDKEASSLDTEWMNIDTHLNIYQEGIPNKQFNFSTGSFSMACDILEHLKPTK